MTVGVTVAGLGVRGLPEAVLVAAGRLQRQVEAEPSRPCVRPGADPEAWFPVGETAEAADRLCAGCPVLEICLERALLRPEPAGIWGGRTTEERVRLRRARQRTDQRSAAADDGAAA